MGDDFRAMGKKLALMEVQVEEERLRGAAAEDEGRAQLDAARAECGEGMGETTLESVWGGVGFNLRGEVKWVVLIGWPVPHSRSHLCDPLRRTMLTRQRRHWRRPRRRS